MEKNSVPTVTRILTQKKCDSAAFDRPDREVLSEELAFEQGSEWSQGAVRIPGEELLSRECG